MIVIVETPADPSLQTATVAVFDAAVVATERPLPAAVLELSFSIEMRPGPVIVAPKLATDNATLF